MDINNFLQAVYITGIIFSLSGVITEYLMGKTPPIEGCDSISWAGVLLSLVPVVNIITAVCVWSSILSTDNGNNPPPGCAC